MEKPTEEKKDFSNWAKVQIAGIQVRQGVAALFCLTAIAVVAMFRLSDPENIIINIVIAIGSYKLGQSDERRRGDAKEGGK